MIDGVRVLLVEDDLRTAAALLRGLRAEGLVVDVAPTGEAALGMARATEYDAVVLDVMLPGLDGFETCRRLRADRVWAPVLMRTARDAVEDRVRGLDQGADDYLTKPFSLAELRALARRGVAERPAILQVGDLRLDPAWDLGYEQRSNAVEVYVRYLREKIDRPFGRRSPRSPPIVRSPATRSTRRAPRPSPTRPAASPRPRLGTRRATTRSRSRGPTAGRSTSTSTAASAFSVARATAPPTRTDRRLPQ